MEGLTPTACELIHGLLLNINQNVLNFLVLHLHLSTYSCRVLWQTLCAYTVLFNGIFTNPVK